jgi:hypothetical protein
MDFEGLSLGDFRSRFFQRDALIPCMQILHTYLRADLPSDPVGLARDSKLQIFAGLKHPLPRSPGQQTFAA